MHTLEIAGLVKTESANRAHRSTSASLHLAVPPQPLLVLLDSGRQTNKKTEKHNRGGYCTLGRLPSKSCVQEGRPSHASSCNAPLKHKLEMTAPLSAGLVGSGPAAQVCQPVQERSLHKLLHHQLGSGAGKEGVAAPGHGCWGHSTEVSKGRGISPPPYHTWYFLIRKEAVAFFLFPSKLHLTT